MKQVQFETKSHFGDQKVCRITFDGAKKNAKGLRTGGCRSNTLKKHVRINCAISELLLHVLVLLSAPYPRNCVPTTTH